MAFDRSIFAVSTIKRFGHAIPRRRQHLEIDSQLAAILDGDVMLGRIGVQHRRNIILGMAGGKQHPRHSQHMINPLFTQLVEASLDHRCGKFQIAIFNRPFRKQRCQFFSQHSKFGDRRFRPAAMTANHNAIFGGNIMRHEGLPF